MKHVQIGVKVVESDLDEACRELTGRLLSERGGIKLLADFLGESPKQIERFKNGSRPNKWLTRYIKLRAVLSILNRGKG